MQARGAHSKQNALDECTDEELCGSSLFVNDDICKIVQDKHILNIVGKHLQHVVLP